MSIEAINEQLLRAIGVGVALVDADGLRFRFHNDTFAEWFGTPEPDARLGDLFPGLDLGELTTALEAGGRFTSETTFKLRRRTMVVAMDVTLALDDGQRIAVLVCQNITRIRELESMIDSYSMMVERNTRELKREKEQVEHLLLNMMPRKVYEEYKTFGVVTPRLYQPVSVLTVDFAGFGDLVQRTDPGVIVSELNDIYTAFDRIGEQFGCERIKTIGDVYVTVAGVPDALDDHASSVANVAVRLIRYLRQRNESHPNAWHCRIGLASGAVVGSVVGVQKYIYDVFGPAVTRAQRLRLLAEPMTICADAGAVAALDGRFDLESLGPRQLDDGSRVEVWRMSEPALAIPGDSRV
ncbi:adenylate/guanylate cyclase domain-containing protein [Pararhodobacter sp. SW119]|uniref:adenylate/guanylate cyclase domain-containing protein n=1 Tax=Pararhodobacter sp. SW119 TaxID=2780075 RepID=UPI001AE029BF|nr:adenylate/guanylate cyclase domain-containing protein [Pararhodobacter sp. SW119]